ncbi:putative histone methyltransferase activity H3-K27 specific protein [Trypoxylus dichotomus]
MRAYINEIVQITSTEDSDNVNGIRLLFGVQTASIHIASKKQHLGKVPLKKSAAETCRLLVDIYGDHAPSEPTCRYWFQRFKSGDFDVNDKERDDAPRKCQNEELGGIGRLDAGNGSEGRKLGNDKLKERDIERLSVTDEMLLQ